MVEMAVGQEGCDEWQERYEAWASRFTKRLSRQGRAVTPAMLRERWNDLRASAERRRRLPDTPL